MITDFYKLSNLPFGKMEYQTFDMMTGVHLLANVPNIYRVNNCFKWVNRINKDAL